MSDSDTDNPTTSTGLPLISSATGSPSIISAESDTESTSTSSTPSSVRIHSPPSTSSSGGQIDLGTLVQAAAGSWDRLKALANELPDDQKKQYLSLHSKPATTDSLHSHPVTKQGRTWSVSFQMRWLEQFPWLSYSTLLSGGICRYCILFPEPPGRGEGLGHGSRAGIFILSPYKYPYTKALGKDGIIVSHDRAVMHCRAAERADLFLWNYSNPSERIDARLMSERDQQANENKHVLRQIILLAVEFLAKQALPFRGHRDDKVDFSIEDANRGNFIATLQLMAKGDSILNKHLLSGKRNARYTSKTIQNEVVHIYACKIRERLTKSVRENNLPFTIIADETIDHRCNTEILSVCLRFVYLTSPQDPHIKECLLSFIQLDRANAASISRNILEAISDPSVSLDPRQIRGQAYDGASVMSSELAGVQAKIKEIIRALYTHCYSHCLNLAIAASCNVQEVRNLISLINESHLFLSNSPKRQRLFELTVKEFLPSSSHSKLPGLCKTRWVERHTCFEVFLEMYEALITFLDAILSPHDYPQLASSDGNWNWDSDTRVKAQGLKAALSSFQTIAVFLITKSVLDEVKSLASKLQKKDQDIHEAFRMVDAVINRVKTIRNTIDTTFSSWYDEILKLAETIGVPESVPRKTSLQRNRSNTPSTSPQQHYKRAVAIPLIDCFVNQLEGRFHGDGSHTSVLLCLIPSVMLSSKVQLSNHLDDFLYWKEDLPYSTSLASELRRWQSLWHQENQDSELTGVPSNLLLALGSCDVDSFPNIHCLLVIACTLPITSAEAERSFSLLRRIKPFTRSTLASEHLSDLAVMSMHYGERISVDEIFHAFVQAHPRRIFQATLFMD